MKKHFLTAGLILMLLVMFAAGCEKKQPEPEPEPEKPPVEVRKETELLLGFESYEEITGAGLRFSSLFGKTAVNTEKTYITEGEGSWQVMPQGNYGSSAWPYFRMRLPNTSFKNSSFMEFDKVLLDVYNTSEEEVSIEWSFNVQDALGTYTETEAAVCTLAPNAWTTCEYELTSEEYETFLHLDTVKLMTVNILSKKESKDDTVNTLYFDNLRGHYADKERVMQDMAYDFREGITFENRADRYLFVGGTAATEYLALSRVAYADTKLSDVGEELGSFALKGDATGATWPAFTVNFGETFEKDTILTFMLYVQADEAVAKDQTYFIESFYSQDNKTHHEVLTKSCKFNRWVEVNIRTKEAASSVWSYINLDDGTGASKCAGSDVTVYMDNFKVSQYKSDTAIAEDGTITITNPYNTSTHTHKVEKALKKGEMISFDIDFNTVEPLAVWVLGDKEWLSEWYAHGYDKWEGKQKVTVKVPEDTDFFYIVYQYRGENADKRGNVCTISNIRTGKNETVVKEDGTVILYNEYIGGKSLSYTFERPAKEGEYVTFDIDVDPAQHMAVWLLGDDMWKDEYYAYGYSTWPGKQTISVKMPADTKNFTIQVEFRDNTKDFSKNAVTISNVKIGNNRVEVKEDGSVVLYNDYTGAKSLSYTFNKKAKQGQIIKFDVDVNPAQKMAVWLLGDDMWKDEWYAYGYDKWTGKRTITVDVPSDTDNFTVQVEFRDPTKDFSKNVVTISNVTVIGASSPVKSTLVDGVLTISGDGAATASLLAGIDKAAVKEIRVEAGITGIASGTFSGLGALQSVYYGNTVTDVAADAFVNCAKSVVLRAVKGKEYPGGLVDAQIHSYYSFKCLTLGSSYGEDTSTYLYKLARNYYASLPGRAQGDSDYDEIVIAVLFNGGGTLQQRVTAIMGHPSATCHYEKWDASGIHISPTADGALSAALMKKAMQDEYWDMVILMQSAEKSNDADSFIASTDGSGKADMDVVIDFAKENNKNDANAKYYWLQTWSYNYKLNDPNFASASGAEERQRLGIVNSMKTVVWDRVSTGALDGIIPVGASIENLKASCMNVPDTNYDYTAKPAAGKLYNNGNWSSLFAIQRDTAHASVGLGRFTAGLTAFAYLAGLDDSEITALAESCYPKSLAEYEISEKLKGEQASTGAYLGYEETREGYPGLSATAAIDAVANPYDVYGTTHRYIDGICTICGEEEEPAQDGITITGFAENRLFQDWVTPQRWYIALAPSTKIAPGEPAVVLGNSYKVSVNGEEKEVQLYKEADGDLALLLPASLVPRTPQEGTVVTILAQKINEEYTLAKDFSMVYAGGTWKELRTLDPCTFTGVQRTDVFITTQTELAELYSAHKAAYRLTGLGSTYGIYYNGKLAAASIEYSQFGGLYFGAQAIKGSPYAVGDVVSMKGIFTQTVKPDVCYQINDNYGCTALGATNPNNNLTAATWEYRTEEEVGGKTEITITGFAENRLFQDWVTPQRWYIALAPSMKIAPGEPAVVLGNSYKVSVNGEEKSVSFYKEVDGDLALLLPASLVPKTPEEGTVVTILAQEINEDYVLREEYSIVYAGGTWKENRE